MRTIEDLRNKHQGEEIWILGTGPSLDDFPKDFFRDKITIALKYAVMAFPHHTYSMCNLRSLKMSVVLKKNPRLYKMHIFSYSKGHPSKKKHPKNAIYMRVHKARHAIEAKKVKPMIFAKIDAIMKKEPIILYGTTTISHWAIQLAAIMGAKKITLVGCEDKFRKYGGYAKRVSWFYYKPYKAGKRIRSAGHKVPPGGYSAHQINVQWKEKELVVARKITRWLAEALKQHGIGVALYHPKKTDQYKAGYLKLAQ